MSRIVEKIAEEARQEGLIEGEIKGKTDFLRELIQRLNNLGASVPEMVLVSGHTEEEVLAVLAEIGVIPQ